jgi:hypothetical protein
MNVMADFDSHNSDEAHQKPFVSAQSHRSPCTSAFPYGWEVQELLTNSFSHSLSSRSGCVFLYFLDYGTGRQGIGRLHGSPGPATPRLAA